MYPPISRRDIFVNFLDMCIAICLGSAKLLVLRFDCSCDTLILNLFDTALMTASILICFLFPDSSRTTFLMSSIVILFFVIFSSRLSRAMAPSSSRMLPVILSARHDAASWDRLMPHKNAFFSAIAMRVSIVVLSIPQRRPHLKRETSLSSRETIDSGGQSLVITICFFAL